MKEKIMNAFVVTGLYAELGAYVYLMVKNCKDIIDAIDIMRGEN